MPNQHKSTRYYKRSRSSSSHHRQRRPYDNDKPDRFDKYHRRSRSRTPPREEPHKNKYHFQYQHRDEKRYYQTSRNEDKNKNYEGNYSRRDLPDKREREKIDQNPIKFKYNRNQQKQSKYRDREQHFQKRVRPQERENREYKRRKSSPSRSRSSSHKRTQAKMVYKRRSPQRQKEQPKRYRRQNGTSDDVYPRKIEQEKARFSPTKIPKAQSTKFIQNEPQPAFKQNYQKKSPIQHKYEMEKQRRQQQNKPLFRLKSIPPPPQTQIKRQQKEVETVKAEKPFEKIEPKKTQIDQLKQQTKYKQQEKQAKQQQGPSKVKVNKFDLLIEQARHSLSIGPPKSTFLLLDTFRTMNKFQIQTLDPKWMAYLKKDMDKYPEEREQIISKMNQPSSEEYKLVGQQYVWMKQQRNEQELDLRFRFEQFKQHNANLSQLVRKIRLLD